MSWAKILGLMSSVASIIRRYWYNYDLDLYVDFGIAIWNDVKVDGKLDDWELMRQHIERIMERMMADGVKKPRRAATVIHGIVAAKMLKEK